jgi:ElaB/YqjD/DUF883 family membrane-anchored ribosome-binding protein
VQTKIEEALRRSAEVAGDGKVTLSGNVRSWAEKERQCAEIRLAPVLHSFGSVYLSTMEVTTMNAGVFEKTVEISAAAAQVGAGVGRMKEAVTDAVEDGINATKRAVKQSRRAAEDLVEDAEYQVKHHPISAVGVSFGIGLGLGAVIGILLARAGTCDR